MTGCAPDEHDPVMGMTLLVLALYVVAVARMTRILVVDKVSEPGRAWLIRRYGAEDMRVYLAHCVACTSVWVGFVLAPAAIGLAGLSWWLTPFVALAASHLTILGSRLDVA